MDYESIFHAVIADPRYQQNLDWGKPRSGHPEGTVRAHIAELEQNLKRLKSKLSDTDYWKLKLLIHVHDSFKAESKSGVPISHARSHASMARAFLAEFCSDQDLLAMVQYHDESYALWRQFEFKGSFKRERLDALIAKIQDWNLFLAFSIIDACTIGKDRQPILWLFQQVTDKVESTITEIDIIF